MEADAVAEVKLPDDLGVRHATLLARFGKREATPFIWLGDESDQTIYVAFGPLRNKRQYFKLLSQGSCLVNDIITGSDGKVWIANISHYVKEKLDSLWSAKHQ